MDPQRIRLEQGVLIRYLNILLSYVVSMLGILCQSICSFGTKQRKQKFIVKVLLFIGLPCGILLLYFSRESRFHILQISECCLGFWDLCSYLSCIPALFPNSYVLVTF